MYCTAINPTFEVVRLNANAARRNPNLQDIVEIQQYQAQLLALSSGSCAAFPSNVNVDCSPEQVLPPLENNGLNAMGGRPLHDNRAGWQPTYVNTKRIMHPLCVELERRGIETSEYYFGNAGIPLSTFINTEQERRDCAEKANAFVIRQHCREATSSSVEDVDSPSSSSSTFMSFNESSNLSSSSGQSSDSVNASEGYRRRLICNERRAEQQHFYDKQTERETIIQPRRFNRTSATVPETHSETIRPRTRMHKGDVQSHTKSSAKYQSSNYIKNASKKHHIQPTYRTNKTIYVNCPGIRQNTEDLGGDPSVARSKYGHQTDTQRENKHALQKRNVAETDRMHESLLKERIEKFEQMCQNPAAENNGTSRGCPQTKPRSQGKRIANHTNQGDTCRLKEDLKLCCKYPAKTTVSCPKGANEHEKKRAERDGKGKVKKMFLGLYEVLSVLGVGGGGMVYAGIRVSDSKSVAIKRIMREKIKRWEKLNGRQVPQEIILMLKANGHKNVIRLLDWYECLDSFILILERPSDCIDLFDYIRDIGRIGEEEAAYIFRQIVEAVRHIHSKGVLHRDIKDENVVINSATKRAKIIDFGCGTLLHDGIYNDFSGTPEFYPPEWFSKHQYKGKSAATWSLGILLYDMLCGEIPFKTRKKIVENALTFKVPISKEAKHLIMWMLFTDEEARPDVEDILNHPWLQGTKL